MAAIAVNLLFSLTIGENPMLLLKKIGTFSTIFRDDRQYKNGKRCIRPLA